MEGGRPLVQLPSGLAGKKVFLLGTPTNQFADVVHQRRDRGSKSVGMSVTVGGSAEQVTSQEVQDLENAVNAHVSVIILLARRAVVDRHRAAGAKAAGIPVIETFIGNPAAPLRGRQGARRLRGRHLPLLADRAAGRRMGDRADRRQGQLRGAAVRRPAAVRRHRGGLGRGAEAVLPERPARPADDNVTFGAQTVQQIQSGTQVAAQNPAGQRDLPGLRLPDGVHAP